MLRICRVDEEGKDGEFIPAKGGSYAIARQMLIAITNDKERRTMKLVSDRSGVLFRLADVGGSIEAQTSAVKFVALLGQASRARGLEQKVRGLESQREIEE